MREWTMFAKPDGMALFPVGHAEPESSPRISSSPDWCARMLRAKRESHITFLWAENAERVRQAHWLARSHNRVANNVTRLKDLRFLRAWLLTDRTNGRD